MTTRWFLLLYAACDPVWGVHVSVRGPGQVAVEGVTVAVACPDGIYNGDPDLVATTDARGHTQIVGMALQFPVGCDVFVAKPGFRTRRIRYAELCPSGPAHCERDFHFDLVVEAE
jgi:hypothetical protein